MIVLAVINCSGANWQFLRKFLSFEHSSGTLRPTQTSEALGRVASAWAVGDGWRFDEGDVRQRATCCLRRQLSAPEQ
eukprot:6476173-Amphidinium_carterae.1